MNGVKVNIGSQMIQLIINSFEAKPHPHKDTKRKLMLSHYRICDEILQKNDKTLLDGIPDVVPNYTNEGKTKDGTIDLYCMSYIHMKEICNQLHNILLIFRGLY